MCGIEDNVAADKVLEVFSLSGGCLVLVDRIGCGGQTFIQGSGYDSVSSMCPNTCDACGPCKLLHYQLYLTGS